ncbi:MAG: nitroimidazol reductase NimA-like FMN-containing flavoprotein [Cyclobacteriaceae bacterium]|jgi:nitroimidazol reductase NimA-like FMN-containing flavoprotein (pyridoxamine 5'-phosphate oxidase superfamily)
MPKPINQVNRSANRSVTDQTAINQIIDSHFICHLSYLHEGIPLCIPTAYGRSNNTIYLHGAVGNRMLKGLLALDKVSITITHLDGLVLARSLFNHSFNYRSVVAFGKARSITDDTEKLSALKIITDNIIDKRYEEARTPNEVELKRTLVVALEVDMFSAKVRAEGVNDDEEDMNLPIWAGIVPLKLIQEKAIPEPSLDPRLKIPVSIEEYDKFPM